MAGDPHPLGAGVAGNQHEHQQVTVSGPASTGGNSFVSVYQATVDQAERNTSHAVMLDLIGTDRVVLDVGCASGYLAEALGKNGCRVSGVEYDPADAEKAKPFLDGLVIADLNSVDLAEQFPTGTFDTVVFGDVLEHLLDPATVVKSGVRLLRPDGSIVISIPNIAHGATRLTLLQGRWDLRDTGLLDRTHIRWFTLETLLAMLDEAGLVVTELRSTVADPLQTEITIDPDALPPAAVDWVRRQPHALDYQFILSARRRSFSDKPGTTVVEPALVLEPIEDAQTERARRLELAQAVLDDPDSAAAEINELRHQLLTSRDHAIGTEAQIGLLRARLVAAHRDTDYARTDAEGAHKRLGESLADAQHAHSELAKSIADSQSAHRQLHAARQEVQQVHEQLHNAIQDASGAHHRLARSQEELAEAHERLRELESTDTGLTASVARLTRPIRRMVRRLSRSSS